MEYGDLIPSLESTSERLLKAVPRQFYRYIRSDIDLGSRLIILKGCRGVGKTTLIQQILGSHQQQHLYLSLDNLKLADINLAELINELYAQGYRLIGLDEVHKSAHWSQILKNVYDTFPDLNLLVTASSALDINQGMYDLSRRADVYTLHGLSFREFLQFEYGYRLDPVTFEELTMEHPMISESVESTIDVQQSFNRYRRLGYYPFYKEAPTRYYDRLNRVVLQVIENDFPAIFSIDYSSIRQLKKLLILLARLSPFSPNISQLARDVGVQRDRILLFLDYLGKANLIHLLHSGIKSDSYLTKPEKIFLDNTNLHYALGTAQADAGSERETFAMNSLSVKNQVLAPAKGDFLVNGQFTLEVGGKNKSFHQIADMANPLLIKDGIIRGKKDVIPLWMLGLLY